MNDAVLSVKLDSRLSANFTFKHLETEGVRNPTCVYWDVLDRLLLYFNNIPSLLVVGALTDVDWSKQTRRKACVRATT